MSIPKEIKKSALNKWKECLKSNINGNEFFPWYYKGAKIDKNLSFLEQSEALKNLSDESREKLGKGYTIDYKTHNYKLYGSQSDVNSIHVDTIDDFIYLIGKEKEYKSFVKAKEILEKFFLQKKLDINLLKTWETNHINDLQKIDVEDDYWDNFTLSLSWLLDNPNSNLFIREIPIKVHTKFIENNSDLMASLFSAIKDVKQKPLEELCQLKTKQALIRFRMLSPSWTRDEMALPLSAFNELPKQMDISRIKRAIIIENEIVYLTFPIDYETLCIFGSGFQAPTLQNAVFLNSLSLFYFGDLDEHGFQILSLFRKSFNKAKSFLMDDDTYNIFSEYAVKGKTEHMNDIEDNLTEDEVNLLRKLKSNKDKNRLEQERISQEYIKSHLYLMQ